MFYYAFDRDVSIRMSVVRTRVVRGPFASLGIQRCRVGWTAKLQVHVLFASHVILRYSCQTGHVPRLNHWEE